MSDKIDDTLNAYETLLPAVGARLKDQVKSWTGTNRKLPSPASNSAAQTHNDAERARRRMVRAYLLAYQALGLAQPGKNVEALRKELAGLPKPSLETRLASDIAPL